MTIADPGEKAGCVMPIVWLVLTAVGTFLCFVGLGIAISDSESAGVTATMVVAFPLGLLWCGAVAALVTHFAVARKSMIRVFAPMGCALFGGCVALVLAAFFFAVIFPEL